MKDEIVPHWETHFSPQVLHTIRMAAPVGIGHLLEVQHPEPRVDRTAKASLGVKGIPVGKEVIPLEALSLNISYRN